MGVDKQEKWGKKTQEKGSGFEKKKEKGEHHPATGPYRQIVTAIKRRGAIRSWGGQPTGKKENGGK